jgi:hypothetical protein
MKSPFRRFVLQLAAVLLFFSTVSFLPRYLADRDRLKQYITDIGWMLTASTDDCIYLRDVNPALEAKRADLLSAKAGVSHVAMGDDWRTGDGTADARLYLTNRNGAAIGLRLKRINDTDSFPTRNFTVLSFWTITTGQVQRTQTPVQ